MKIFTVVNLLGVVFSHLAVANSTPGLDVTLLKQRIAPHREALEAGIERARSLKGGLRGASREINYDECKVLEAKIEAQYPVSPFRAIYKNGASFSSFCDWNPERPSREEAEMAGKRYFFEPIQAVNQLGVPAAYVVRILSPKPHGFARNDSGLGEYLLDSNFRFIEISGRTTFRGLKGFEWDVAVLGPNGDQYFHSGSEASGDRGFPVEQLMYSSSDGTLTSTWRMAPRRADRGNEIIVTESFQVNEKNWQNQGAPLNKINGSRFFQYEGEWTSRPTAYSWLFEVSLADGAREVCADGSSISGEGYTRYGPSDKSDSWACYNIW